MLTFTVENSITYLTDAPEYLLASLDKCLSYPTQIGVAKDEGATYLGEDLTWDGWVHFLKIPKRNPPHFPTGLWPQVKNLLATWRVPYQVTDRRIRPDEGIPELTRIPLRDYQERAVELAIEAGQGVLDMPPRAGKTRVAVELVRRLALPTIWVAPTDAIVQQTLWVFDEFLGKGYAVHQIGTADLQENSLRQVVLCTAATAGAANPRDESRVLVRPLVPRTHQLDRLHLLRAQLREATELARLAIVRRFLCFHRGALRGDVRLSADDLSALRLAGAAVSRRRSPLA